MKTSTALILAGIGLGTVFLIRKRQVAAAAHDRAVATTRGPSAVAHGAVGAVAAAGCGLLGVGCPKTSFEIECTGIVDCSKQLRDRHDHTGAYATPGIGN